MTNKIKLELPPKHTSFLLDAVKEKIKSYNSQLDSGKLNEDEIAEIENDLPLFISMQKDIEEKIREFGKKFQ